MINRRKFLKGSLPLVLGVAVLISNAGTGFALGLFEGQEREKRENAKGKTMKDFNKEKFPVQYTDAEWKELLSPASYRVLREHGTEPAFSSALNKNKAPGSYLCAGCDTVLFSSEHKYDSGSGWPSFYQPVNDTVLGTSRDFKLVAPRTEVHCATCGGHLGHVFEDGPKPTGLRYCINGVALKFKEALE